MLNTLKRTLSDRDRPELDEPLTPTLAEPRDAPAIIDEPSLERRFLEAVEKNPSSAAARAALIAVGRDVMTTGRAEIKRRFQDAGGGGDACVHEQAHLMDCVIAAYANITISHLYPSPNPTKAERFAIAATGGYGRGELFPYSDIDLLFLLPYKRTHRVEQTIEAVLYFLWDLGLKVGHAVRTADDCIKTARQDTTIRTCLLESRPLWGDRKLYGDFRRRFDKAFVSSQALTFVEAKLAEREIRHQKLGDSRYFLEPNIKESKGGLRDLQTLLWIARYVYRVDRIADLRDKGVFTHEEVLRHTKAQQFLWTLRCNLHYLTNRGEERLTFDVQREIAQRMGYADRDAEATATKGVERFMKHYFLIAKHVGDLTRTLCASLEANRQRKPRLGLNFFIRGQQTIEGFSIDGGRLDVEDDRHFRDHPVDMIRLFRVAQVNGLDIHPHALLLINRALRLIGPKIRNDPEANRLFMEILTADQQAEATLRKMNEAGVLGRFVEDFGRVVAQMQFDMYHVYTVDEHTLQAVGTMHAIDKGELAETVPDATAVMGAVLSRRALYVGILLHDIAKGRGGDHSEIGAKIARKLGPRLGLSDEETETVEWLVRYHLAMSWAAFRRDVDDDKTVEDFVASVGSPERLRLLFVLTTADIHAVGPGRWNGWKATLLSRLYQRAMERMSGGFNAQAQDRRIRASQESVRAALTTWSEADIDAFLAKGYPPYWLSLDTDTHVHHASIVRAANREGRALTVETRIDRARQITEVTILTADHPGLFSQLSGALTVSGANIVEARIFTLSDGMALDVFLVQDAATGAVFDAPDKLARLSTAIELSQSGDLDIRVELAKRSRSIGSRTKAFRVPRRVLFDDQASNTHTVIEVNGRDRPGLLFDVTQTLFDLRLQISSAKISTYGARIVDVFYVKDAYGLKVTHEQKKEQIRAALTQALGGDDDPPAVEDKAAAAEGGTAGKAKSGREAEAAE